MNAQREIFLPKNNSLIVIIFPRFLICNTRLKRAILFYFNHNDNFHQKEYVVFSPTHGDAYIQ